MAATDTPQVTMQGVMIEKCRVAACWFRLRDRTLAMCLLENRDDHALPWRRGEKVGNELAGQNVRRRLYWRDVTICAVESRA